MKLSPNNGLRSSLKAQTPKCKRCGGGELFACSEIPALNICYRCCDHQMAIDSERKWFFCGICAMPASALWVAHIAEWIDGPVFSS